MSHLEILHQIRKCYLPIQGKKLHAHVIKSGFDLGGPLFNNTLLDMYGKCGHLQDALQLLDEMPQRDLASWVSIFTAFNRANLHKNTLFFFSDAVSKHGLRPDDFIYSTLINACASLKALKVGEQLHAQFVVSMFSDDDVVKSSLVNFYAKCGLPDKARGVFDSIVSRNVVSCTSLMYGYARAGRKSEVLDLLRDMPYKSVQSWSAVISGFVQAGLCLDSFKLYKELWSEGVDINVPFVLSSLIAGSTTLAMLELGRQVHRLVIGFGYESDLYVSNALIDMYAKCSDVSAAEKIFGDMRKRNIVSWTSIIIGMAQHGRAVEALSLYDQMTLAGVKPNEVTFVGVIYACSHAGLVDKGRQLFKSMVEDYRLRPSLQHYTCLVDLYSRSGLIEEAEDVLNTMPFKPDEAAWAALLNFCCQGGKKEIGVRIANHLLQLGPETSSTCIMMSNIYARAAMWEQVSRVRKLMGAMELKKKPGYSSVDLGKEIEVFHAGETTHPMKDEIFGVLKELDAEMRKRGYVPDTSLVLHDMQLQEKERLLFWHSERTAVAYGLLKSVPGSPIRILKNLRVCGDCHTVFKFICSIVCREIIVRDANRFHHFKDEFLAGHYHEKDDSVDVCLVDADATHFDKSLQELRDFSSQLYQTAKYSEATFLAAEDKTIILENTKQYISMAVVATVEHLSSLSANLESCLFESQTTSISQTNRKIESLKTRIMTCQQRSHHLALERFYLTADFSKHHRRYILPPSTDSSPMMNAVSRDSSDGFEAKTEMGHEFETDEPLFLHTYNCKPTLVESSKGNNVFSSQVLPVRGDGLSVLPNSEQPVFQFKEALKLKRSAINWKALSNREMASIIKRGRRILA